MFKFLKKLEGFQKKKLQYKRDGYITGLPVFNAQTKKQLNDFFVTLSSRLSRDIDIN